MQNTDSAPRLILDEELTEKELLEIRDKGWLRARVETQSGARFLLSFYDASRPQQEVDDAFIERGEQCFAEPNLVVIPGVTPDAIRACLRDLESSGFFESLFAE